MFLPAGKDVAGHCLALILPASPIPDQWSLWVSMQAHLSISLLCLPQAACSPAPGKTPAQRSGEQEQWDVVRPELLFWHGFSAAFY